LLIIIPIQFLLFLLLFEEMMNGAHETQERRHELFPSKCNQAFFAILLIEFMSRFYQFSVAVKPLE